MFDCVLPMQDSRVEDEVDETFSMIKKRLESKESPECRRKHPMSFKEKDGRSGIIKCHSGQFW